MRKSAAMLMLISSALTVAPIAARADHKQIEGRTGLPAVRDGGENVWMKRGQVSLNVRNGNVYVTQDFLLQYPGPPLETGSQRIKVAVRDDFYRSIDDGASELRTSDARGLRDLAVSVDGRRVATFADPWMLNDKKDTATRWHNWYIDFRPGQTRRMRITSWAPLGRYGENSVVEFVSKDLGHWRDAPDELIIRLNAPGATEARVAGLEPDPKNVNPAGIRWVYRKASPNRDVFALIPRGLAHRTGR